MNWVNFSSSYVNKALYESGTLFVQYKDAKGRPTVTCQYDNVGLDICTGLLSSPSKGRFVNSHIRSLPYKIVG